MALFGKRKEAAPPADAPTTPAAAPPPWAARSGFVKQAVCARCGAQKSLPTKTAYLYCDHCGALVDYDFRLANDATSAETTNMVYAQVTAPLTADLAKAKALGDRDTYRDLQRRIFTEWIARCPQAVSPRAKTDEDFRERMITYLVETTTSKDLDPRQQAFDFQMKLLQKDVQRVPSGNGSFTITSGFWPMAALFKQQMELAYQVIEETGVAELDPDDSPPGVPLHMELSTFCQGWLPHLPPADGERLLSDFGLTGQYVKLQPQDTEIRSCGGCGAKLRTVVGAQIVVCEDCGKRIDVAAGQAPCRTCGAPLTFPVGADRVTCPYCRTETQRV